MSERMGRPMGDVEIGASAVVPEMAAGRGQPSIVVSIPGDASQTEIDAMEASIRAAKPTGNLSKEETFKTWLE